MSLRGRLSLAFVLLALVPLAAASVLVALVVPHQAQARAEARAQGGARAAWEALRGACTEVSLAAEQVAARVSAAGGLAAAAAAVTRPGASSVGAVLVIGADGSQSSLAGPLPGQELQPLQECNRRLDQPYLVARAQLADGRTVLAASPVDQAFVTRLARLAGTDLTVIRPGTPPLASRADGHLARRLPGLCCGTRSIDGRALSVVALSEDRRTFLVANLRVDTSVPLLAGLTALLVVAVGVALLLASQVARMVTRPITDLGLAARRITEGDLDTTIPVTGSDEVAVLGHAFNEMTRELRRHISDLEASRDDLRGTLTRLGETLSSTHDLDRILGVIIETAQTAIRARSGALFLLSGGRQDLYLAAARGLDRTNELALPTDPLPGEQAAPLRIEVGSGVVGKVFESGEATSGHIGPGDGDLHLAPGEPRSGDMIAVPLRASGRVTGVLALYDHLDGSPFDAADLDTIRTFAAQAGVAIDNVLLHQEAQRLSITDGLTGLWNYRYLTLALNREIERAVRFNRPLAVLMLDLDRFKSVNDRYGHQRGDSVLIEVASRVKREIREVDVLARYGGEELVCVLPETDIDSAVMVAERINKAISSAGFVGDSDGSTLRVTVSIGVSVHPVHASTAVRLLRAADEALYDAKHAGRDCVRVAGTPQPTDTGT
jgi:two-component system cell cycle response regulator